MVGEENLIVKSEHHEEDLNYFLTKIFTTILDHNCRLHYNELWRIVKMIFQEALAALASFSFPDVLSFLNRHPTVFSVLNNEVHVLQDSIHVPNISSNDGKIIAVMAVFFDFVEVFDQKKLIRQLQEFCESINKYQANLTSLQKFHFFQIDLVFIISSYGVIQLMSAFNGCVQCVTVVLGATADSRITAILRKEIQKSGKMHCVAAMNVSRNASTEISKFFSNFSVSEKYWFFENHQNHFHVLDSGYVQSTANVEEKVVNYFLQQFRESGKFYYLELIKHLKKAPSNISDFFDYFSGYQKLQFFRNHPEKFLVGANSNVYIPGEIMKDVYDKEPSVYSPADVGKIVGDMFTIILNCYNNRLKHKELWKLLDRICDEALNFCSLPSSEILSFLTQNCSFFSIKDRKVSLTMTDSDCGPDIGTCNGRVISLLRFFLQNYDKIHYEVLASSFETSYLDVERFHSENASNGRKFFKDSPVFNTSKDGYVTVIHESESQVIDFFISKLQQWGKLHFLKLMKLLKDSSLPISNFFDNYSRSQKYCFFKDRQDKFKFGSDGYGLLDNVVEVHSVKQDQSHTPSNTHSNHTIIVDGKSGLDECSAIADSLVPVEKHSECTAKIGAIEDAVHPSPPGCCVNQKNDGGSKKLKSAIAKFFLSVLQEHGRLHYRDLIEALRSSSVCNSHFFDKYSELEKREFFKRRSEFNIDHDGYVLQACEVGPLQNEISEGMGNNSRQSSQNQNDLPGKSVASDMESESKVVNFLLLKLEQHGKVHYSKLVWTLKDSPSDIFHEYSMTQNLQFFIVRPNVFTVDSNGYVQSLDSLAKTAPPEQKEHGKLHRLKLIEMKKNTSVDHPDFFNSYSKSEKTKQRSSRFGADRNNKYAQACEVGPLQNEVSEGMGNNSRQSSQNQNDLPGKSVASDMESESKVVNFLLLKLEQHGKVHYSKLVRTLKDSSSDMPDIFHEYSMTQNLQFFIVRPNVFTVDSNGYVQSLDLLAQTAPVEQAKVSDLAQTLASSSSIHTRNEKMFKKKLNKFMLSKLEEHGKLHHLELIEMWQDTSFDHPDFFDSYAKSEKMEFFKQRSNLFDIDHDGYVQMHVDMSKSNDTCETEKDGSLRQSLPNDGSEGLVKSITIDGGLQERAIDFLLAQLQKNGRMHISELVQISKNSSSDISKFFGSCSDSMVIQFFKGRSDIFVVDSDGFVRAFGDSKSMTSSEHQETHQAQGLVLEGNQVKSRIAKFLLSKLQENGRMHYSKLIKMLKDSSLDHSDYFNSHSEFEKIEFFKQQSDRFIVHCSGHLEAVKNAVGSTITTKQTEVVYESKESVKQSACNSLRSNHASFDEGAEVKVIDFMLSHLHKKGQVHFMKLIQALENSSLDFSNFFEWHTPYGKHRFFKDKPNIFFVDKGSFVKAVRQSEHKIHHMTVNEVRERKVIEFSLLQLKCLGRMHYSKLIELVKISSLSDISDYFDTLTESKKFKFFTSKHDKFYTKGNGISKALQSANNLQQIGQCVFADYSKSTLLANAIPLEMYRRSEGKVVEFLLSHLRNHGKTHYLKLGEMLKNFSSVFPDYFGEYSYAEILKFLEDRPDKFSLLTDRYVEAQAGLQKVMANIVTESAVQQSSINSKNHQETSKGFPVLHNEKKVVSYLLSVLGDESRHYRQLIYMAMSKSLAVSLFFENYSAPDELEFLQKHPDQFHVDADGYVRAAEKKRNASPLSSSITSPGSDSGVNTHSEDSASCSWTYIEESGTIVENHNIIRNSSHEYTLSSDVQSPAVKDIRKPFISSELYKKLKEIIRKKQNKRFPNHSSKEIEFAEIKSNKTGVSFPTDLFSAQKSDFSAMGVCDDGIVNLFSSHLQAFGKMHYRELFVILEDHALSTGMEHERMQPDEQLKFFDRHSCIFHVDGDGHVSLVMPKEGTKVVTACVGEEKDSPFPFLCCKELKQKISCRYVKQLSDVHIMSVQHLVDVLKSGSELTVEELVKKACDADEYVKQFFSNFSRLDFALFFEIHSMFFSHNSEGKIVLTNAVDDHSESLMSGKEVLHAVHANIVILLFLCVNALKSVTKVRCKDLECVLESTPAFVLSFMFTNYPGNMFFFQFIKDYSEYFSVDADDFVSLNDDASFELIEHWILALFPSSISLLSDLKQEIVSKLFDSGKVGSNISNKDLSSIRISDSGVSVCEPVDANLSSERSNLSGINFECLVGERFSYVNGIPTECNEISAPVYKNECLLMNDFSKEDSFENRSMNVESDTSSFGTSMKAGSSHNHMNLSHVQGLKQLPVSLESSMENVSDWLNSSKPPSKLNFQNFSENPSSVSLSEIEKRAIKFFRKVLAKRRVPVSLSDLQLIVCAAPDDVSDYLAIQFRDLHTFFQKHQNIFRSTTQTFVSLEISEENIS